MQNDAIKKTKSAHKLVVVVLATLFCVIVFFAISSQNQVRTLRIGTTKLTIEIATSSQEKSQGLCCRDSLPKNSGMLFVYHQPGDYRFWMKDTKIPLDMYWINSEKRIVHIEHSVKPESYPESFGTEKSAQYILETNAGFAKSHNITIGDTVKF